MPAIVVDVPRTLWNEVVLQSIMHGLDMFPDRPTGPTTVVEITGSWDKLNQVYSRAQRRGNGDSRISLITVAEKLPITGG
jgi:hypothetical protein